MKFKPIYASISASALLFYSGWTLALPDHAKAYGLGEPAQISDLPPGRLRSHIESLPAPARDRALEWLQQISFPAADVEALHVDGEGGIFYVDSNLPDPVEQPAPSEEGGEPEILTISAADAFSLHSKPGSSNVLFLDFDGHVIPSTSNWTNIDLYAVAYDNSSTDDDSAFTASELNDIAEIWHRIAEDFAPYDVDVTTEEPSNFTSTTGHLLFTKDTDANGAPMPAKGAGGVAYLNVWDDNYGPGSYVNTYSPALVYYDNLGPNFPPFMAEAGSHEFGHNQGLSHDATSGTSYYPGHGSGLVSWAPLMGTGYNHNVTQWSKGEYTNANNFQDDLAIMDSNMGYRTDDHGDTLVTATALTVDGTGAISSTNPETDPHNTQPENKGIIELRTDVDMFYFDAAAGSVSLTVLPAWDAYERPSNDRGANLDIEATLYDDSGSVITTSDPTNDTRADINTTVTAGRYYLGVTGVGNTVSPYTDYASLGFYYILGNIVPQNPDNTTPTPNPMTWAATPFAQGKNAISMTATTATDDSGFVEYKFFCVSGGQGCSDSGWQSSASHTATGLAAGTEYTYQTIARDGSNNQTTASVSYSATTDPETPPAAPSNFAATPISTSEIDLSWQDNADNENNFVLERSLDGSSGWNLIATPAANSSAFSDTGLDHNTTYYYRLKAVNSAGDSVYEDANGTTDSLPASTPYPPISETAYSGTVSGTYQATQTDGDGVQSITERQSGGKPANRHDFLEHRWTFNINGGAVVSLFANTWTNADGLEDDFIFEVSTDGTSYTEAFTVTSGDVNNVHSTELSSGISGTIYVRVRDTNQESGKRNQETIYVDHLYILVENAVGGTAPDAPSGLSATADSSSQITINWIDESDNESGFKIERSPDGSNWSEIGMAGANTTSYVDSGLSSNTTYHYKAKAFNANGESAFSDPDSATTDVGSAISLSVDGYKVKGVQHADLTWSGATTNVDIIRNGALITTTTNDDFHTDNIGNKGGGSYTYEVCDTGTSNCSDPVNVVF